MKKPTDKERLDWLTKQLRKMEGVKSWWWLPYFETKANHSTFRAAIDAAMKGER
jgi:hypothetical protein